MRVQCAEQGKVWGRSWRGAGSGSQAAAPRFRRSYIRWRAVTGVELVGLRSSDATSICCFDLCRFFRAARKGL